MNVSRIMIAGAAALAGCGVLGVVPPAAQASSAAAATWTRQHPAVHPPARYGASVAYDAATGTAVLFGGWNGHSALGDTWTWDGTTWTQQHPAIHPSARYGAAVAYDAATGTVVLFGGENDSTGQPFGDTWTWDGTTWTKQAPVISPPARDYTAMAYDAATGTVVLFSGLTGQSLGDAVDDTWAWNGTAWTQQAPATSPPAVGAAAMAYDAASGTVVLFGGSAAARVHRWRSGTWTWDGTTWTQQDPAAHPSAREQAAMAYDAATGTEVLFGGFGGRYRSDTWTWDGTTWTRQHPAAHMPAVAGAGMAYDAATGTVVVFGGAHTASRVFGGTWTWG